MKKTEITTKICKHNQEFSWNYAFFMLEDLYEKWYINDEKYNNLLNNLLTYVETKITPPNDAGDIIKRYVVVEYEEINKN
ncbi:MAG: hypothetical protein K2L70_07405 [Clostridia bacterium]|nr:hypothetical protein [Clostridia bacterium]